MQRSEVRGRDTQAGEEGRCGRGGAKRSLKHTGARPVDGAAGVLPETWNLKPGTEVNSFCARRVQLQNGQGADGALCGKRGQETLVRLGGAGHTDG